MVDQDYGLHPSPEYLAKFPLEEQDRVTRKYIKRRVAYLTDGLSRYLCAPAGTDVRICFIHFYLYFSLILPQAQLVPFTHVGIKKVIYEILFNPKSRTKPLATVDLESIDPIPIESVAYAATAVWIADLDVTVFAH